MAEGHDFGYDDKDLDDALDNDDYDDPEVNRTGPFDPYEASTPYNPGEQHQMQTMMHEQTGLPDQSYEETPLLGAEYESKSWDALTCILPNASAIDLETSYSKTGRLLVKMKGVGKKSYYLFTRDNNTGKDRLNPSLPKEIKNALGKSAEEVLLQDQDTIREQRQRLKEAEKQQRQAETLASEREAQSQDIQNLGQQIERTQARIDDLQKEHGSNLESETELNRLKQLKKKL